MYIKSHFRWRLLFTKLNFSLPPDQVLLLGCWCSGGSGPLDAPSQGPLWPILTPGEHTRFRFIIGFWFVLHKKYAYIQTPDYSVKTRYIWSNFMASTEASLCPWLKSKRKKVRDPVAIITKKHLEPPWNPSATFPFFSRLANNSTAFLLAVYMALVFIACPHQKIHTLYCICQFTYWIYMRCLCSFIWLAQISQVAKIEKMGIWKISFGHAKQLLFWWLSLLYWVISWDLSGSAV